MQLRPVALALDACWPACDRLLQPRRNDDDAGGIEREGYRRVGALPYDDLPGNRSLGTLELVVPSQASRSLRI
jgi:hypothetical protein